MLLQHAPALLLNAAAALVIICLHSMHGMRPRLLVPAIAPTRQHVRLQELARWSLQLLTDFSASQRAAAAERGAQAAAAVEEAEAERAALFEAAFELLLFLTELLDHVASDVVLEARLHPMHAIVAGSWATPHACHSRRQLGHPACTGAGPWYLHCCTGPFPVHAFNIAPTAIAVPGPLPDSLCIFYRSAAVPGAPGARQQQLCHGCLTTCAVGSVRTDCLHAQLTHTRREELSSAVCMGRMHMCGSSPDALHRSSGVLPAPPPAQTAAAAVQSIFQGCHAVLTAVPRAVLGYPAVADACALAVLRICEVHAARVLRLPPDHFAALLDVLLWGLRQPSVHTVNLVLRALGELAGQHQEEVDAGMPGLGNRTAAGAAPLCEPAGPCPRSASRRMCFCWPTAGILCHQCMLRPR